MITGREALALGIVNKAVPKAELGALADEYAAYLAGLPTVAIGYMKRNLNAAQCQPLGAVLDMEATHQLRTMMTSDHKQASAAFVQKAKPVFHGR